MKPLLLIVALASALAMRGLRQAATPAPSQSTAPNSPASPPKSIPGNDNENARKARALLDESIKALGGQAFLDIHDIQEQGRTYSFYHGRPTSNGIFFWRFVEFPNAERIELTPQRDVAYVYAADKGYEITYKGAREVEKKDLDDYLRHRRLSLDAMLRVWKSDPTVALFYDGEALAGSLAAEKVTLINSKDEAVSLYFDADTHLPIKKSYSWRDPVDKERNTEEETYDNYRSVQGIMTAYGFTRYFNGDMQTERFLNSISYNKGLDEAMFNPNSGYNPNKPTGKHQK
jgi:hypothetical protein